MDFGGAAHAVSPICHFGIIQIGAKNTMAMNDNLPFVMTCDAVESPVDCGGTSAGDGMQQSLDAAPVPFDRRGEGEMITITKLIRVVPEKVVDEERDAVAKDEAIAMDAKKQVATSAKDCKAKNKFRCPYHGQAAMNDAIREVFKKNGLGKLNPKIEAFDLDDEDDLSYKFTVTCPKSLEDAVLDSLKEFVKAGKSLKLDEFAEEEMKNGEKDKTAFFSVDYFDKDADDQENDAFPGSSGPEEKTAPEDSPDESPTESQAEVPEKKPKKEKKPSPKPKDGEKQVKSDAPEDKEVSQLLEQVKAIEDKDDSLIEASADLKAAQELVAESMKNLDDANAGLADAKKLAESNPILKPVVDEVGKIVDEQQKKLDDSKKKLATAKEVMKGQIEKSLKEQSEKYADLGYGLMSSAGVDFAAFFAVHGFDNPDEIGDFASHIKSSVLGSDGNDDAAVAKACEESGFSKEVKKLESLYSEAIERASEMSDYLSSEDSPLSKEKVAALGDKVNEALSAVKTQYLVAEKAGAKMKEMLGKIVALKNAESSKKVKEKKRAIETTIGHIKEQLSNPDLSPKDKAILENKVKWFQKQFDKMG